MSMSLFSYGKMDVYRTTNRKLPFIVGYDSEGNLTDDPGKILNSKRPLPIGYRKGSGLSIMLDILATMLSQGKSTSLMNELEDEYGLSQVFICFDTGNAAQSDINSQIADQILDFIRSAVPSSEEENIYYPGERIILTREENKKNGIPVDESIWKQVTRL